jgi:hypothetical protein
MRRGGAGSPFDEALQRAVQSLSVYELRDYDVTSERVLLAAAPPPDAVQYRGVFGHLY